MINKSNTNTETFIHIQPYQSPCGKLILGSFGDRLCLCHWSDSKEKTAIDKRIHQRLNAPYKEISSPVIQETIRQLEEYFAGRRQFFHIPLLLTGTDFQMAVWNELPNIIYGETISYSGLAARINRPNACRAVANACRLNAITIIVPCHRVIGSNYSLTGFSGGINTKGYLLQLEKADSKNIFY